MERLAAAGVIGGLVGATLATPGDFGKELEILDGVAAGDPVIVNVPDEVETGLPVEVVAPPAPKS